MARTAGALTVACCAVLALAGCAGAVGQASERGFHLAQIDGAGGPFGLPADVRVERVAHPPGNDDEWTVAGIDPASTELPIAWGDGGTPECGRVDLVQVFETARTVAIGVLATRSGNGICPADAHGRTLTVHLAAPLGRRALVEGATGVNDGLPKMQAADVLADPACPPQGEAAGSDVPVGASDAARRLAPLAATSALVCRTAWPKGSARNFSARVDDPSAVSALVAALNRSPGLVPAAGAGDRCDLHRGTWDSIYLTGGGTRVEVRVDDFGCTVSNGAVTGGTTSALLGTLDALFPASAR